MSDFTTLTDKPKSTVYSAWAKAGFVFSTTTGAFLLAKTTRLWDWLTLLNTGWRVGNTGNSSTSNINVDYSNAVTMTSYDKYDVAISKYSGSMNTEGVYASSTTPDTLQNNDVVIENNKQVEFKELELPTSFEQILNALTLGAWASLATGNIYFAPLGLFAFLPRVNAESTPIGVSFINLGSLDTYAAMAVMLNKAETLAFVADYSGGLKVINVSNPTAPVLIGGLYIGATAFEVILNSAETLAFVVSAGLDIVDVSNPAIPVLKGRFGVNSNSRAVALNSAETLAFITTDETSNGLSVIDVSNPVIPVLKSNFSINYANTITLNREESLAFVTTLYDGGLKVINISNPEVLVLTGSFFISSPQGLILNNAETLAFVADNNAGLKIIDVNNPAIPTLKGSIDTYQAMKVTLK